MPGTIILRKGSVEILQFEAFNRSGKITHGFTTRRGGASTPPFGELNMALHVGDQVERVQANRVLACATLGINAQDLVAAVQTHGKRVEVIGPEHKGRGALEYSTALPDTDALVTQEPGVPLSSYYADCVPILLYDPVKTCVGLAHAGWRGTVQQIAAATVQKMVEVFGCETENMLAGIGPSIGPCCYQVDEPVRQALEESFPHWRELLKPAEAGRWFLDLWETNHRVLLDAGLRPEHITVAELCTACHSDVFFSYRVEQGKTGRMASLIMICES